MPIRYEYLWGVVAWLRFPHIPFPDIPNLKISLIIAVLLILLIIVFLIAVLLIYSRAAFRILSFILLPACTSSHTEESTKAIFS